MQIRIETRHLRLVATLAEEHTLTRAARRLYLTQSALSKQLLELESRIGAQLFVRAGKRLIATAAGLRLLETAEPVLKEIARVEEDLRRIADGTMGRIRLSTECYTCYHWLPHVLEQYRSKYPNVDIDIVTEATRRPLQAMLRGELDLGIFSEEMYDPRFTTFPLFADELVAVVHPQHRLAQRSYIEAADLADEHLIVYAVPREELTVFIEVLNPAGVIPRRVSNMALTEGMLALVKAGIGVAVLARWAAAPDVANGSIVALPITAAGIHRRWCAVTMAQERVPAYLSDFVSLLAPGPKLIPALRVSA